MNTNTPAPAGVVSSTEEVAAESWVLYPQNAPYRTAQMVDASAVAAAVAAERERCASICDLHAEGWEVSPGSNPKAGFIAASNCAHDIRRPNAGDKPPQVGLD